MKKLTCEICGGDTLLKEESHFRCTGCGACYAPSHLRARWENDAEKTAQNTDPQPVQAAPAQQTGPQDDATPATVKEENTPAAKLRSGKFKKILYAVLGTICVLALLVAIGWEILTETGLQPEKSYAQRVARTQLTHSISKNAVTVKKIQFDSVEATRFQFRDDDPIGYFLYIETPMTLTGIDGTTYESYLSYYRSKYGADYDPEDGIKWAYVLTGTYEATDENQSPILGKFHMVYVDNAKEWCLLKLSYEPA